MKEQDDNTIDLVIKSTLEYYKDLKRDPNGRYLSWEHCYSAFRCARIADKPDIDYLSLQLSFYLASWGMYRGSSFLLQKDYKIHLPVIKELLNRKYDPLFAIECTELRDRNNQKLLEELNFYLENYYTQIRCDVKEQKIKNKVSPTLITKILMGTLGCVPAYDRYFIDGIKQKKIATGSYNIESVLMIVDFYEKNKEALEKVRQEFKVGEIQYPQMKLLDMGFWKIGFDAATKKSE